MVGHQLAAVLRLRGCPPRAAAAAAASWLLNPVVVAVSTRGNCEGLAAVLVLEVLLCLMQGRVVHAALWYGSAVHLRLYPIIYALPILLVLRSPDYPRPLSSVTGGGAQRPAISFALVSGAAFVALGSLSLVACGSDYLREAWLYHITRADHRHNFSIYFYSIYLGTAGGAPPPLAARLAAFLPQAAVQAVAAARLAPDLPFCMLVQTATFVAFNKVITAQYFVWVFALLPLALPASAMPRPAAAALLVGWAAAQAHWLGWAYALEFEGRPVLLPLWAASLLFFAASVAAIVALVATQHLRPLFRAGALVHLQNASSRAAAGGKKDL
eukprot:SM001786S03429  [mRNA]  locus=s1786:220:1733:- [translate_table: standard]